MLSIQEKQEKVNWVISKPSGGYDDLVDSEIYATVPFFDEGQDFGIGDGDDFMNAQETKYKIDTTSKSLRADTGMYEAAYATNNNNWVNSPM